ncbi:hypothetical protein GCM10023191_046240 [Actinoallomurus oryzae]|uniref:DUF397 domain-containing protein n=1 Tax=Actinoallomurus oryzae TaxID=502180 RepID=A0ABP8QC70_9ACTN
MRVLLCVTISGLPAAAHVKFEERAMAADPDSLILAEPWRKGSRSGGGGCVEAARVAMPHPRPADAPIGTEGDIAR